MTRLQMSVAANGVLVIAVAVLGIGIVRGRVSSERAYGSELGGVGHAAEAKGYYDRYLKTRSTADLGMAANQLAYAGGELTVFGELTNAYPTASLGNVLAQLGADLSHRTTAAAVMRQVAQILQYLPQKLPTSGIPPTTFNKDAANAFNHLSPNSNLFRKP